MTDATLPASPGPSEAGARVSEATRARLKSRYAAERRFRFLGAAALSVAVIFLVLLFWNILSAGLPAFHQYSLVLPIDLAADKIDPAGRRDKQAIAAADYFALGREALAAELPPVSNRRERNKLTLLLSIGAVDEARAAVIADPALIGTKLEARLLLSANADLYFKGQITAVTASAGRGAAKPTGQSGEVTIILSALDLDRPDHPRLSGRTFDDKAPSLLVAIHGGLVKIEAIDGAGVAKGRALLPLSSEAEAGPGAWRLVTWATPESSRKLGDQEIAWLERLREAGRVQSGFNWRFFFAGDSREPELAGIRGAMMGSALMLLVTLALCLPIGVLAAIYLEQFAPRNRLTDLIEVNINNLAAVPSIVFGLLGLAVFLNFLGLPRSAPLVGGLVLALLVLPTVIIAARAALKAVPPSIKEAALGVGASDQQAVFHHVLPLAMPGIMTGTIIGMAHALGETAPLLMIGMVAFIVDVPSGFTDAATALPVQIYLWSDLPEIGFRAKTAAAIIVLLVFLFVMNGLAIFLRRRFEQRW